MAVSVAIGTVALAAAAAAEEREARAKADGGWNKATPFPFIQGTDCCARVVAVADGVDTSLLGARVPLIIDGGQAQVGIESTVIDLTSVPPRVLRPGMVHEQALLAVVHAERDGARAFVDALQPQHLATVGAPVAQILGADPEVTQRLGRHVASSC